MARVLITDGEQRSALAAARSLGRAGHTVFVAAHARSSLAGSSRYVQGTAVLPDPLTTPAAFVERIVELVRDWEVEVLLPVSEAALLAVLPERERINALLPFPAAADFQRLCDKQAVAAEAEPLGIKVPRTVVLQRSEDFRQAGDLAYPVVLKPHRSISEDNGSRAKLAVRALADEKQLELTLQELPRGAFPVLLQEKIVGPGVGIFVLIHDGELRAAFAHQRIREKPPWGGVSVYRESIPIDEELLARSVALLGRFHFEGAAMVEYKIDRRTSVPYIMEINGRLWGSLQLAIDAGVDFPALLLDAVLARPARGLPAYRAGTRSRWFWGDVDNLLLRLRGAGGENGAPPSRVRACLDFVRAFGPRSRSEVLRLRDPWPAVRETLDWFGAMKPIRSKQ